MTVGVGKGAQSDSVFMPEKSMQLLNFLDSTIYDNLYQVKSWRNTNEFTFLVPYRYCYSRSL